MNIKRELNLLKRVVYNITRFTTLDYKDNLSCIVWFVSCNMRCQYCYNSDIIMAKEGAFAIDEVYDFLEKRIGLLDAVVLSGGEATVHDLYPICKKIKQMGFKIKLDTNGSNPKLLKKLISENLLDFIALDFKSPKYKYNEITKTDLYDKFYETLNYLINEKFDFEVRTTLHDDLLSVEDINDMIDTLVDVGYNKEFHIQNFLEVENLGNLKQPLKVLDKDRLSEKLEIMWRN